MAKLISEYKYLAVEADPNIEGDTDGYIVYREPENEEWNEYQNANAKGVFQSQRPGQEANGIMAMSAANIKLADALFIRTEGLLNKDGNEATKADISNRMLVEGLNETILAPRAKRKIETKN